MSLAEKSAIGERIVYLLSARKMSQKDLARAAELTDAAISRYVSGERAPKGAILLNIANALGTTLEYLLGESSEPFAATKEDELEMALKIIARNSRIMTAEEKQRIAEILFSRDDV